MCFSSSCYHLMTVFNVTLPSPPSVRLSVPAPVQGALRVTQRGDRFGVRATLCGQASKSTDPDPWSRSFVGLASLVLNSLTAMPCPLSASLLSSFQPLHQAPIVANSASPPEQRSSITQESSQTAGKQNRIQAQWVLIQQRDHQLSPFVCLASTSSPPSAFNPQCHCLPRPLSQENTLLSTKELHRIRIDLSIPAPLEKAVNDSTNERRSRRGPFPGRRSPPMSSLSSSFQGCLDAPSTHIALQGPCITTRQCVHDNHSQLVFATDQSNPCRFCRRSTRERKRHHNHRILTTHQRDLRSEPRSQRCQRLNLARAKMASG